MLIKGSKDSDSSLVSNENFSEILCPSAWALGQATWAKMTQNYFTYDVTRKKSNTPQPKVNFECNLEKTGDQFEPLSSSLAQSVEELGCW